MTHSTVHSLLRAVVPTALGIALLSPAFAAVSVSDITVAQSGSNIILGYRLNEAATSVSITVGGQTYTGATAKGLNTVNLPSSTLGQSATITATAPAENGAGGAVVLAPFTQDATSNRITGIDVVKRDASALRGHVYVTAGFAQTGAKKLFQYAADGAKVNEKDLTGVATSGSWPFGLAVAQNDPNDYVYIANRTLRNFTKFLPTDLSVAAASVDFGVNNYVGFSVTPNNIPAATDPWQFYLGGNRVGNVIHGTYNGATTATVLTNVADSANDKSAGVNLVQAAAVDPTNQVLFKVQVYDVFNTPTAPLGTVADTDASGIPQNVSKWTSSDQGQNWTEDTTWGTAFAAAIGADSSATALGVALDKGFDANNLANAKVWISVSAKAGVNKLYHVNAATGAIIAADTIDLTQVAIPSGTTNIATYPAHFLSVTPAGNIALTVNDPAFTGVGGARNDLSTNANFWGILAPNTAAPTTDTVSANLTPSLVATGSVDRPSVGNSGTASVTYTVVVTDPNAKAGTATVTGDLSPIGGPAAFALTKASETTDHTSATFTGTYAIPTSATLGSYDLPFTVTLGSKTLKPTISQDVYKAYVPAWTVTADGPVNSSPAANGTTAYIGADTGSVYAINAATGALLSSFGTNGKVNLGGAVTGQLQVANGKLYVNAGGKVHALSTATGSDLAASTVAGADFAITGRALYLAGTDNKIHELNADTLTETAASADLGSAVNRIGIGPSSALTGDSLVVAGTEGGKIVMLKASDLTQQFAPITDPKGAVRSRPVFTVANTINTIGVGGASGFFGINADTGALLSDWGNDTGLGQNGNPYNKTDQAIMANPTTGLVGDSNVPGFIFASRGTPTAGGSLDIVAASNGARVSFGGLPVPLTVPGSGFDAGAGVLRIAGNLTTTSEAAAMNYLGADGVDQRFFAVNSLPEDFIYAPTADKVAIFNPKDTATFPGATGGAFLSTPVLADNRVVVGSAAGKVYGFDPLVSVPAYVTGVTPANGASGVPTSQVITLTFSGDISALTVDSTVVHLFNASGAEVPTTVALGADNASVTITPNNPLANGTYTVVESIAGLSPFSSTFTVGQAPLGREDVQMALKIAAGLVNASSSDKTRLDQNGDGHIDLLDATIIARKINGK